MSFDEKQQMDVDEFDLAELFTPLWYYKFILLMFVVLSVPLSIMVSKSMKPTYKAQTVFEKPVVKSPQGSSLLNNVDDGGLFKLLSGGIGGGNNDSFFSEIRSESFLKTVIFFFS